MSLSGCSTSVSSRTSGSSQSRHPRGAAAGFSTHIDYDDIYYYIKPTDGTVSDWDMVPDSIKDTYEKLGIPEAERKYLAGCDCAVRLRGRLPPQPGGSRGSSGVLFCDMDTAVREYPELVQEYFGTIIPPNDNKFAALNSAVWSGGSFIYVPPGVHVEEPLQAYFRINAESMGQFERTLIIVDEGAFCHYVEGCSAPVYTNDSLHAAVVEVVVKEGGRCRYTTIQNWSNNVLNLVTKRAAAYKNATMEWVDGNLGSGLTMKYPAVWLMEEGAHGEVLSIAFANTGQVLDAGAKMVHVASGHDFADHIEVDQQGRRPCHVSRTRSCRRGCRGIQGVCHGATHYCLMRTHGQTPIRTWRSRSPTSTSVTRRRCQRSVRISSSIS